MKEIWFIRHGESEANAGLRTLDTVNINITEQGRSQAEQVSLVFDKTPDLIIATPYIRTQQTSEPTRKLFPQTPYEIWDLQEFSHLDHLDGPDTTRTQRRAASVEYWEKNDPDFVYCDGVESFSMMMKRIKNSFDKLKERDEQFIAVFTHGMIIRAMVNFIRNPEHSDKQLMTVMLDALPKIKIENCQILKTTCENSIFKLVDFPIIEIEDKGIVNLT